MNPRDPFEQQLRETFRRVEPPPDLAQRILRRVESRRPPRPAPRWLAAAASVILVAGASLGVLRWREERLRAHQAEQVRQQLALTLEITSRTLARADQRLKSIGVQRIRILEVSSWQEF